MTPPTPALSPDQLAPRLADAIPRAFPGATLRIAKGGDAFELVTATPTGPAHVYLPLRLDPGPDASPRQRAALERTLAEMAMLARSR